MVEHFTDNEKVEGPIPSTRTREVQSVFSEKFNRDARSASLSVVGVIKILRPRRERFEPKNFLAEDFFNERVGVTAVSI